MPVAPSTSLRPQDRQAPPSPWVNGLYAYRNDDLMLVVFSGHPAPEDVKAKLQHRFGGMFLEGARLIDPDEAHEWPDGADEPDSALFESSDRPGEFRVFRYRRDVDRENEAYEPRGPNYATVTDWLSFAETWMELNDISRMSAEDGSDAVLAEIVQRERQGGS